MQVGLVGIALFALYIYLTVKFKLDEKYGALVYFIGLPVFMILCLMLLVWLGVPIDASDDGDCVKWNWSTGECTKKDPLY